MTGVREDHQPGSRDAVSESLSAGGGDDAVLGPVNDQRRNTDLRQPAGDVEARGAGELAVASPSAGPGAPDDLLVFRSAARRRARPVKQLPCHPVEGGGRHQGPDSREQCATRRALRRGGGAPEGQRPDSAWVVKGQLKSYESAHRHAVNVGGRGAGGIQDSQRVVRHQLHGVGPRRVGATADPPVVETDNAVGGGEFGDGAMPHVSPVGVAHDEQDRVARPALVPPDPGIRALDEWHRFPFTLICEDRGLPAYVPVRDARHARTWPRALAAQRHNDHFGTAEAVI